MPVFRAKAGVVAIYDKATSGDPDDPFVNPLNHVNNIRFHSDFQYLSNAVVVDPLDVTHTLLAGSTGTGITVGNGSQTTNPAPVASGQIRKSAITIYTHGLGYPPLFQLILDRRIVTTGTVIQNPAGQLRMISAFATSTQIKISELAMSSASDLPAIPMSYKLIIFQNPEGDPLLPTLWLRSSGMILARGKVTDVNRPLRRVGEDDVDEDTFYIPTSRTLDIKNGAIRNISPLAGVKDYGTYTGSFTSAIAIKVTY